MKTKRRIENIMGVMFVIEKHGNVYNAHWIRQTGEEVQNVYRNFKTIRELKQFIKQDMVHGRQLVYFLEGGEIETDALG